MPDTTTQPPVLAHQARYRQARERAGLSQAQAAKLAGWPVAPIEVSGEARPEQHASLATLYGVTPCWLAGHQPSPDLTDLQHQAEDKGVSFSDWREIVTFAQALSQCPQCATAQPPITEKEITP